jgi:hypothetical protein
LSWLPGPGDDGAAERVADEHRRAGLLVENAPRDGNVVLERQRRVLNDADVEPLPLET